VQWKESYMPGRLPLSNDLVEGTRVDGGAPRRVRMGRLGDPIHRLVSHTAVRLECSEGAPIFKR
jgi:hypothetical protein